MEIEDTATARALSAAFGLCRSHGSATVAQIAAKSGLDEQVAADALAGLAKRGDLLARPGGVYAMRGRLRTFLVPGASLASDWQLQGSIGALTGARA